jgi:putative oxidoreductase
MRPLLARFHEPAYALLRVVVGLMFASHGSQALLNFPAGEPHELPAFIVFGKVLELVGGLLVALGLCTPCAAFVLSGEMAVGYFRFHAPGGFWPVQNQGELAVVYCFVFLLMATRGSGPWSLDALIGRGRSRG